MNEIEIFNRKLVKERRNRYAVNISEHDFIINLASGYMLERLIDIGDKYKTVLDLGCHSGQFGTKLIQNNLVENVIFSDISQKMVKQTKGLRIVSDEEFLPFAPRSFNLIASAMSLHWTNDLPGTLIQAYKCLKNNGIFIATIPGIETLKELRHCLMEAEIEVAGGTAPHISPFTDVKTMGHLLQRAGFQKPVADSETVTISYTDIFSLMRDLRNMGEGNALTKRGNIIKRPVLELAAEKYKELYGDGENGIIATIEIITVTGSA